MRRRGRAPWSSAMPPSLGRGRVTNSNNRTGKSRAGEERIRKQVTNFKEAVCCPSAVVQGAA